MRTRLIIVSRVDSGFSRSRIDPDPGERFVSLCRQLGISSFGLNEIVLEPGQRGRIHRHERQEEVYLVLEGSLTLEIEGEPRTLARGELARVAPDLRRRLSNRGDELLLVLAIGGAAPHEGRDGLAFASWEDTKGAPPQEIPIPPALP